MQAQTPAAQKKEEDITKEENIPTQVKTPSEAKETALKVSNWRPYPSYLILI